jgi:hypothetical protein
MALKRDKAIAASDAEFDCRDARVSESSRKLRRL